jgi:hypothetical protein
MCIIGSRSASILFAAKPWTERESEVNLVLVSRAFEEIAEGPFGLFEKPVVHGRERMLRVGRFSHTHLTHRRSPVGAAARLAGPTEGRLLVMG